MKELVAEMEEQTKAMGNVRTEFQSVVRGA